MQKEMININGNLITEVKETTIESQNGEISVANFTLFRKIGQQGEKKKEYISCNLYGDKVGLVKDFKQGDFIHVYGYFKEIRKGEKTYKNFIVKHTNKIEKTNKEENEEE